MQYYFTNQTELLEFTNSKYDTTHKFHSFSFGPDIPGVTNPLYNRTEINKSPGLYQYFAKVIPTKYTKYDGETISSNQYILFLFLFFFLDIHLIICLDKLLIDLIE